MALPERIANDPAPGTREPIGTLAAELKNEAGALSFKLTGEATLKGPLKKTTGQFRVVIDNEICLCECTEGTTITILTRAAEESNKAAHASGANVYHLLTAEGLQNQALTSAPSEGRTERSGATASTTEKTFEASATRNCQVLLEIRTKASKALAMQIKAAGTQVATVTLISSAEEQAVTVTFPLAAGQKWAVKIEAGELGHLYSSYFFTT